MQTAPAACSRLVRAIQHKPHYKHEQHLQACHNLHSYHQLADIGCNKHELEKCTKKIFSQSNACRLSQNEHSCNHRFTTTMYKCLNSGSQPFGTVVTAALAWVPSFRRKISNMHQQCDLHTSHCLQTVCRWQTASGHISQSVW